MKDPKTEKGRVVIHRGEIVHVQHHPGLAVVVVHSAFRGRVRVGLRPHFQNFRKPRKKAQILKNLVLLPVFLSASESDAKLGDLSPARLQRGKGKVGDYSGIKAKQAQQNWQIEKGQGGNDYDCQVVHTHNTAAATS